jgi:hypothetical protein
VGSDTGTIVLLGLQGRCQNSPFCFNPDLPKNTGGALNLINPAAMFIVGGAGGPGCWWGCAGGRVIPVGCCVVPPVGCG